MSRGGGWKKPHYHLEARNSFRWRHVYTTGGPFRVQIPRAPGMRHLPANHRQFHFLFSECFYFSASSSHQRRSPRLPVAICLATNQTSNNFRDEVFFSSGFCRGGDGGGVDLRCNILNIHFFTSITNATNKWKINCRMSSLNINDVLKRRHKISKGI